MRIITRKRNISVEGILSCRETREKENPRSKNHWENPKNPKKTKTYSKNHQKPVGNPKKNKKNKVLGEMGKVKLE